MATSMAIKNRKLFPTSDPTCLVPPSPLPPPSSTNNGLRLSPYVIVIVTLLATLFLLVSFYVIILKYWNHFRPRQAESDGQDEDQFLGENHGPANEHPIWYITTVGLQSSLINSITVFKYKNGDSLVEGTECSICLNQFLNDETLRLLPKCNHAFHIPCIDTWLRSHTNCPLCRAGIVSNAVSTAPLSENSQNSVTQISNENSQIDNSENDGELDNNQVTFDEIFENWPGMDDIVEFSQVVDEPKEIENPKTQTNTNGNKEFWVIGNFGDDKHEIQAMRRSVSMDSQRATSISLDMTSSCRDEYQGSSV